MELIIDNRENKIKELFLNYDTNDDEKSINYKIKQLDIGDFIIKNNDETILIIERKTIGDLYGSIQDGRYKEQKHRLLAGYPLNKIVYLIEGSIKDYNKKFLKNFKSIVNGAIINTMFRDNIRIIRTCTINETYDTLLSLYSKVLKKPEFFKIDKIEDPSNDTKEYVHSIKIKKKDNMTPINCNIIQLCQIPGVSKNMGICIIEKYGSISKLILEYLKLESEEVKKAMLKKLVYNNSRKIGPVVSSRIYEYFIFK